MFLYDIKFSCFSHIDIENSQNKAPGNHYIKKSKSGYPTAHIKRERETNNRKSQKTGHDLQPTDGDSDDPTSNSVPSFKYHEIMDVIFHQVIRRR